MTAATMLFVIACVVAVLGFGLAGVIWTSHPVRWTSVECGTLRNPVYPPQFIRAATTSDPASDIFAALAPGQCDAARATVLTSQRTALAAGGVATAMAGGALFAARREKLDVPASPQVRGSSGLNGYGLPGRPPPVVTLADPAPRWGRSPGSNGNGDRSGVDPDKMRDVRG